jgi:hypothetical protein
MKRDNMTVNGKIQQEAISLRRKEEEKKEQAVNIIS